MTMSVKPRQWPCVVSKRSSQTFLTSSYGADILKALALGASEVLLGRVYVCGLAPFGQVGVQRAIVLLRAELKVSMGLAGMSDPASIDRSLVRLPWGAVFVANGRAPTDRGLGEERVRRGERRARVELDGLRSERWLSAGSTNARLW